MRLEPRMLAAVGMVALAIGCGGKDDDSGTTPTGESTGTGTGATGTGTGATGTGTGAGTGTGTGTATGGTNAFARMVHLIFDAGDVDIYLNDQVAPLNSNPFPAGGNSDADPLTGNDYLPFPSPIPGGTPYNIKLRNATGDVLDYDSTIAANIEYTIIAMGFSTPPGIYGFPTMGVTIDDSANNAPAAGMHALTMYHTLGGAPDFDVYVCAAADADADGVSDPCDTSGAADSTGLTFGQWTSGIEKTGGPLVITAAIGPYPVMGWQISAPADAWSYLYVMPNPYDPVYGTPWLLHHVHGTANQPTPNLNWP